MSSDPEKIEIRPVKTADMAEIIAIAELLPEAPHWSREHYGNALRVGTTVPRVALVAVDAQSREVVGFAIAGLIIPDAELETIAVAPVWQRKGIASRLLAALVDRLKAIGVLALHLEVRASNHPARRFYISQNFREAGVRPRYYTDPEEDAVLMSCQLA